MSNYLISELKRRDWNQSDLARKVGVSRATISDIITGRRSPSVDLCKSLADALGVPVEVIYRYAGILPNIPNPITQYQETLDYSLSQLDDDQLMEVLQFIEFIKQRDKQPVKQTSKPAKQKREGERPPEVVK